MNEQKNVQLVRDAYAAFGRNDIEGLLRLFADDIDWHTFGPAELPMGGPRRGKAEVRRFFEQVAEAWTFEQFDPRQFVAQGDSVVALGSYRGTAQPTGASFSSEWAHVFQVSNGKIQKFREYTDTANLLAAYTTPALRR